MKNTPFSVTMTLKTPIILMPGAWLTLDALLASQLFVRTQSVEAAHAEIPLMHSEAQNAAGKPLRIWHGSAAFVSHINNPGVAPFKRSVEMRELFHAPYVVMGTGRNADKAAKLQQMDQIRGPYQSLTSAYGTFASEDVRWFGCGDIEAVRDLLDGVQFVGKKHRQGYGQVAGCAVEEMEEDGSLMLRYRGKPHVMRPVPVQAWQSLGLPDPAQATVEVAASEPPYFESHRERCLVPHTRLAFFGQ